MDVYFRSRLDVLMPTQTSASLERMGKFPSPAKEVLSKYRPRPHDLPIPLMISEVVGRTPSHSLTNTYGITDLLLQYAIVAELHSSLSPSSSQEMYGSAHERDHSRLTGSFWRQVLN